MPVPSVTASPSVCSAQHCPLLVPLHFLVCLPWLGPYEAPQRTLRGRPTAKLLVALFWVWVKPFHTKSRLSSLLVAPGDPLSPCHPDALGAWLSRLPSPAASSHTQGCSKHHSAPQCSREEVPGCSSGVAASRSLLLSVGRLCHKMGC